MLALMLLAVASVDAQRLIDEAKNDAIVELPAGEIAGNLVIRRAVTLRGAGLGKTVLRGRGKGSVISIVADVGIVTIERVSITGGGLALSGGGIHHPRRAQLVLTDVELFENEAGGLGAAISVSQAPVLMRRVSVRHNKAGVSAAIVVGGDVRSVIEQSSIEGNHSKHVAGLVSVCRELVLRDVRFEGNASEAGDAAHAYFGYKPGGGTVTLERVVFGLTNGRSVELGKDREAPKVIAEDTKWPQP